MSLQTPPILWVGQDRHFYFFLFLLSRKARNAINNIPKDISNADTSRKIIMISYAVISHTSLPMYFGSRFSLAREATTLSWALSIVQIASYLQQYNNYIFIFFHIFVFKQPIYFLCNNLIFSPLFLLIK